MPKRIENKLAEIRQTRGVSPSELARRVGVSRQTIYAIEAGQYVPNTGVALQLAHELAVSVEDLFALEEPKEPRYETLLTKVISSKPPAPGSPLRVCHLAGSWVGVPVSPVPYFLPEADGIVTRTKQRQAEVQVFGRDETAGKRLLLAGCDPAISVLARMAERLCGIEVITAPASSTLALEWLKNGSVHIAGAHLEDPDTGEFNLPYLRRRLAHLDLTVVTFAHWEEGFVVMPGNPKKIRTVSDLARKEIRFMNREAGSGSRGLIDRLFREAGIEPKHIRGYGSTALGHLAAAYAVLSGAADCCLATPSAARAFGLDFVPLHRERFDLILRRESADYPAVASLLDLLQRVTLRRRLESLAGYETARTGAILKGQGI